MRSATSTTGDDTGTVSDDELPLLMLRALKAMVERLNEDEAVATSKFTPVHGLVTRYLDRHDDVTIIELADHLHVTKQSASELVGALEAGGYVRRRPNPADRRSRFLELTAKGRQGLARSLPFRATELAQRVERVDRATDVDRGDREVQRGAFGRVEPGIREVVVVGVDPVPRLAAEGVDGLDRDRHAEVAQRLLVTLELATAGEEVVGVPGLEPLGELVEGERPPRREERRREVDEPLEPLAHLSRSWP